MATNSVKKIGNTDPEALDAALKRIKKDALVESVIDSSAAELKINMPKGANVITKVTALLAHFLQNTAKADLVDCDTCEGASDINLDNCPFCGSSGESETSAISGGSTAKLEGGDEDDDPEDAEVDEPAPAVAKKASKKSAKEPKAPKETSVAKKNAASAAMVPVAAGATLAVPMTEKNLDAAVENVRRLASTAHLSAWKLGDELKRIFDSQLWKVRQGEDGKGAYKTFDQFTKAELSFSKKYAFVLMKVSAGFTEAQVQEFGPAKLHLVLTAPKEIQGELLERVKKGAKKKEIERSLPRTKTTKAKDGKNKKQSQQITVANILKRQTLKMFIKPKSKGDEPVVATKLAQLPWASLDLANDVKMLFTITQTPGGELRLVVDTRRVEAGE